jgi:hypothetical protein
MSPGPLIPNAVHQLRLVASARLRGGQHPLSPALARRHSHELPALSVTAAKWKHASPRYSVRTRVHPQLRNAATRNNTSQHGALANTIKIDTEVLTFTIVMALLRHARSHCVGALATVARHAGVR